MILKRLDAYIESSLSRCWFRWFAYGKLPNGIYSIVGKGLDDLLYEMKKYKLYDIDFLPSVLSS